MKFIQFKFDLIKNPETASKSDFEKFLHRFYFLLFNGILVKFSNSSCQKNSQVKEWLIIEIFRTNNR